MRRRVGGAFTFVVARGHDTPRHQGDRTDGHLSVFGGRPRLYQGEIHGVFVVQRGGVGGSDAPVCDFQGRPWVHVDLSVRWTRSSPGP